MMEKHKRWNTDTKLWAKLKSLARQKRRQPTPAEDRLWQALRDSKIGAKFRRQYTIERFIADFYCIKSRLLVEVDGAYHQYTGEEDLIRQEFLESQGIKVVRVSNQDVMSNLEGVVAWIRENLGGVVVGDE
jgi:very-short-patch-repair endonuclease